ncbi:calcium-binding protein [Streptomyces paludis]|uniref:Calcium-binding protein n=1 Tax=Streptomyces paludis TaxID=2282738 RepID=A0A345HRZ9_9ACTN|nr:calcium-binding protein [Streptomyces paludis]AXG79473.1 calcium-binding protein [Streptomyces paludis]
MRTRMTVAVVSGALALSALAAPTAQARGTAGALDDEPPQILAASVNGGKPIVVGTSAVKTVTVSITASHPSGVKDTFGYLWTGQHVEDPKIRILLNHFGADSCKELNATTATCTFSGPVNPKALKNTDARTWNLFAGAWGKVGRDSVVEVDAFTTAKLQRQSRLTVAATPKPVKKGKTLTVTGKLSRANWDTKKYAGYAGQSVKLQFRKKDSKTYTTIKTVKGSSTGILKTTTKKTTAEGYWRWSFAGTATTPAVSAPGTLVKITK